MTGRATVVIATRNRCAQLLRTLERTLALDDVAEIIVVDNASRDATPAQVRERYPFVHVVDLRWNAGAYARTQGARLARTPYVAFCDDDSWWKPGALTHACDAMDAYPSIGLVNARLTVNGEERIDDACAAMDAAQSDGLPGRPILYFLAGACVVRRNAFLACGGFERRFFIGGEETLLALDLHRSGWHMRYLAGVGARHDPCPLERNDTLRRALVERNRLWVAWMRYLPASAWRATISAVRRARSDASVRAGLLRALGGLPWALTRRAPVDDRLQQRIDAAWSIEP